MTGFAFDRVVLVGLGGVGTHLASPLCRYLAHKHEDNCYAVILIDGDSFENRNSERQEFIRLGNKAEVTAIRLKEYFPELYIEAKSIFLTADNIFVHIPDNSVVFSMVDNHATHKILSDHVGTLSNCLLISGGNDEVHDGNVQIYLREDGQDITPPLTFHPEIEFPEDRNPANISCDERAATETPQLIFGNFEVASRLLSAFWLATTQGIVYSEAFFDIQRGTMRTVLRRTP